ncbi:MAG: hypothetical protein U9O87_04910, partial [Verrucomicrobiota bacterium]|nr:hypothetical protein [Verrucomicrobiota bacterium]
MNPYYPYNSQKTLTGTRFENDPLTNFYSIFSSTHNKPMMIPETSAFYNTERTDGESEESIKLAWIKQIYNIKEKNLFAENIRKRFPKLKAINWFNHRKYENEAKGIVDWTVTGNPKILDSYKKALIQTLDGKKYFLQAIQKPSHSLKSNDPESLFLSSTSGYTYPDKAKEQIINDDWHISLIPGTYSGAGRNFTDLLNIAKKRKSSILQFSFYSEEIFSNITLGLTSEKKLH